MDDTLIGMRAELFKALRALGDKEAPMDIERAKAVADVAQTIINSARVEVEHTRVTGGAGTGFLDAPDPPAKPGSVAVAGGVTVHRLR